MNREASDRRLQVGECDQTNLECSADRFAPVCGVELFEDVQKVGFNRRGRKPEVFCQPFGCMTLCHALQNLKLPRRQVDLFTRREGGSISEPTKNIRDHATRNRALTANCGQQGSLKFCWPDVLQNVA